ncbi:MAG TPA: RlpA-like double-psi beta-barrel domain-containing protein [bacterium]|nr:RlpA-like double-psi beta-barrel domain-containing protein [bacterium]
MISQIMKFSNLFLVAAIIPISASAAVTSTIDTAEISSISAAPNTSTTSSSTAAVVGKASWYNHKAGFFAASTIFPMGQKVRVHHILSGKFIDVVINDYGPDPKVHPDRVIDLQKEAFSSLATLGTGVITVRLELLNQTTTEPIKIITTTTTTTINTTTTTATAKPASTTTTSTIKRDLKKEQQALKKFTQEYKRLPKNKADWDLINKLAYSTSTIKTTTDFKSVSLNNTEAAAAIVLDANNNQVLWQKNAQEIVPIASLTKMVAIKTFLDTKPNLNKTVTYSQKDEQEITKYCSLSEAALLRLKDGDQVKLKDLVYSALVGSANNAVESLVRLSGLSRTDFIKKMNANVKKWGATNTKFVEPTGLSTDNVSTAKDYALILKNTSQDATIKKISTTAQYKFTTINTKKAHTIKNTNKLLREGQFELQSSKTGYLVEAGHCLAMAAQNKITKQKFIVVTLGSSSWNKSYQAASQLLTTALN